MRSGYAKKNPATSEVQSPVGYPVMAQNISTGNTSNNTPIR